MQLANKQIIAAKNIIFCGCVRMGMCLLICVSLCLFMVYEEDPILTDTKKGFIIVVYEKKIFSRAIDRKF